MALFLTVGGVFLVVGILDLRETQRLRAEGALGRGIVTGRHKSGGRSTNYSLDVEFQTCAGVRVRSTEDVGTSRYERTKPGDTLPLRYLPSDPSVMKIGTRPELDPRGFITSLGAFIIGMLYLFGKRRQTRESVQTAPNDLDEQLGTQAQSHPPRAHPWQAPLGPRRKLVIVGAILLATGAAIAFAVFLLPNAPPRSRDEYLLEGQVSSIALDRQEASIKHGTINGFRPATTMPYRVPDAGALADVKPGDLITATLVVVRDDVHLDDIKKTAAVPPSLSSCAELDPLAQPLTEGWEGPSAPPHDLYFVPVGDVPAALMSSLVADVERKLGIPVTVLSGVSVEPTMFDPARSQLIAERVIAAVRTSHPAVAANPRARVIAVTAQDMYISGRIEWRFALSLRSNDNAAAVVSYARMDPAYLRTTPDEKLLQSRLRKMILKNIGMIYYSLPASRDPRSVLYGNVLGLDDLDYMSEFFEPRS